MTSVMYGIGIEAAGATKPLPPAKWEKLRVGVDVVATPLRRRHAVRCIIMAFFFAGEGGLAIGLSEQEGGTIEQCVDVAYSRAECVQTTEYRLLKYLGPLSCPGGPAIVLEPINFDDSTSPVST